MMPLVFNNNGEDFLIYPEYTGLTLEELQRISEENSERTIIGGIINERKYIEACSFTDGIFNGYKCKTHLTSGELKEGLKEQDPRYDNIIIHTKNNKVLPIICYEICFPEDYYHLVGEVDMIVHLVGYPMFDRHQYKAWYALQKAMVQHFNVPLACRCGGKSGVNNITNIIYPDMFEGKVDLIGNYTVSKR